MESIDFPQRNAKVGKDQPEYQTLYAHIDNEDPQVPVTSFFKLSPEELSEINEAGGFWHTQLTFGTRYNPIRMSTSSPYKNG